MAAGAAGPDGADGADGAVGGAALGWLLMARAFALESFFEPLTLGAEREAGTAGTGGAFPPRSAAIDSRSDVLQRCKLSTTVWYSCSGVGGGGLFALSGSLDFVRLRVAGLEALASSALTLLVSESGFASGGAGGAGSRPRISSSNALALEALLAWLA